MPDVSRVYCDNVIFIWLIVLGPRIYLAQLILLSTHPFVHAFADSSDSHLVDLLAHGC